MDVVITRHVVMPRELPGKSPLRCVIGYYGTMGANSIAVIVGTTKAGVRSFHYAEPAELTEPWYSEPPTEAEMIAAVRAYGFRDGMPDSAE